MSVVTTISFVILFPLVPVAAWFVASAAGVKPFRLSMPMLFIWSYLAFAYFGTLPLYFQWVPYRVQVSGVDDPSIVFLVFLLSSSNLILFSVGVTIAAGLTRDLPDRVLIPDTHSPRLMSTGKFRLVVVLLLALSVVVIADYLRRVPAIALIVALTQSSEASSVIRSQMTAEFGGRLYLYRLFYSDMLRFLLFLVTAMVVLEKRKGDRLLLVVVFFCAIFGATMSGQKAPAAWVVIGMFLTWLIASGRSTMRFRNVLFLVTVVSGLLVVLYTVLMGSSSPLQALTSALNRALTGQITPAYHYLRIFPQIEPYQYGRTFPNPRGILPFEVYPLTRRVMELSNPRQAGSGVTGSMPTVFWGEIHANFGPVVASLVGLPVGLLVGLVDRIVRSSRRTPTVVAFYVWTMLFLRQLSGTGISVIFIPVSLIVIACAHWFLLRWRGHHRTLPGSFP